MSDSSLSMGPLALLLTLIEQRQLDVLTVRLGDLAGAYLDALAGIERGRLPLLSTFVTVCSQPILIKSRALLPRPPATVIDGAAPEVDPEEELRRRLIEYRMFRDAGRALAELLSAGTSLFHREPAIAQAAGKAGARPDEGPPLDPMSLADALAGIHTSGAADAAAGRDRCALDHARRARCSNPHRPSQCAAVRAPGAAPRRDGPDRRRRDFPGAARAGQRP